METGFRLFKVIFCVLCLGLLNHSCTVYRSADISVAEAVESQKKVRIKTATQKQYSFRRLEKDETGIYGIAFKNSRPARHFANDIVPGNLPDNQVKIKLEEGSIDEINPHNKTLSVLIPAGIVVAGVLIFALTYQMAISPW
ncbi:hypothetical protein FHG64_12015 [Antarcticibacterium flavum]|uniref:Uncharacterized protein n=1 Tax=Antarcticibacterium flavum TaxID=2058175 RepID=A0A5B7X3K7_9FLAO|nr:MULTISPECIES: hypothetical protein [Antarcticibacterium]MCM4158300.1 hypothetical protein [Antarcticibacterium sp. W02-3]QCY70066.1 hypothetical protein FHG64_12015 [Antarcticibacterium flavum]